MKKVWETTGRVLSWSLVVFAAVVMILTVFMATTVGRNDKSVFGLRFYIVQTDSMSRSENDPDAEIYFNAGDLIIVKTLDDPTGLQPGDVICFLSTGSSSYGQTITHAIRRRETDEMGALLGYTTYGIHTGVDDEALVQPMYIIGQYAGKLPGMGNFFAFVKSGTGYILCVLIPFVVLILLELVRMFRLIRGHRLEQQRILQSQQEENLRLKRQLEQMQTRQEQHSAPDD